MDYVEEGFEGVTPSILVWGARIRNASELPIFDVRTFFFWVDDPKDGRTWTTHERYASKKRFLVIPPEQRQHLELPRNVKTYRGKGTAGDYLVAIEFTDADGVRWTRDNAA
jgi:hypothetical protein